MPTLIGTYAQGYTLTTLHGDYLSIAVPGYIEGAGLVVEPAATVVNAGRIKSSGGASSNGVSGITFQTAGSSLSNAGTVTGAQYRINGGVGVTGADTITNAGVIAGGAGGVRGSGGVGVDQTAGALANTGTVTGGLGGNGYGRYGGGAGGGGVDLTITTFSNGGTIAGGAGGFGGSDVDGRFGGYAGGHGGLGVSLTVTTGVNSGKMIGGAGGAGGFGSGSFEDDYGVDGGAGGDGAIIQGGFTNTGDISGGAGGAGGTGGSQGDGGGGTGGAGGTGVSLEEGSLVNQGTVTGGAGAMGGAGGSGGRGGAGAGGGAGVTISSGTLSNHALISGGAGGGGGAGGPGGSGGAGGAGGAGVELVAGTLFNYGAINGGAGGLGGAGASVGGSGVAGDGVSDFGVLVNGSASYRKAMITGSTGVYVSGTLTNFGTISGTVESVLLGNAGSRLVAEAGGSTFIGLVRGTGGVLELAGGDGVIKNLGGTATLTGAVAATVSGFGAYLFDAGAWTIAAGGSVNGSQSLDVAGGVVTAAAGLANAGLVEVYGTVDLGGVLTNTNFVQVGGSGGTSGDIVVAAAGATLSGGGTVRLGGGGVLTGADAAATLTNANDTIIGYGQIGNGQMTLDNEAGGVIKADYPNSLTIDTGAATLTNAGLIESDSSGLTVTGAIANTGTIAAIGVTITLEGKVTGGGVAEIYGGMIDAEAAFQQDVDFAGSTGVLALADSRAFSGQINGLSPAGGNSVDLQDIAFAGGVTTAAFAPNGQGTGGVLTVKNGSAIASLGMVGDFATEYFVIASDGEGGTSVTLAPFAQIQWASAVSGAFTNPSKWTGDSAPAKYDIAILDASGAAFTVTSTASDVVGGVETTANATLDITGGTFTATAGTAAGANAGAIDVGGGATLALANAVDNTGTIALQGGSASADLHILAAGATLMGGGTVSMSGTKAAIAGLSASTLLTNVDNTISGQGAIGAGALTLDNESSGVIDASLSGQLTVNTGAETLLNTGVLEATGAGAVLLFKGATIDNQGGTIEATAGMVELDAAEVIGGTLMGAGTVEVDAGSSTLDALAGGIALDATVKVIAGTTLTSEGTLAGTGALSLWAGARLVIGAGGLTLSGGGHLNTNSVTTNTIVGATATTALTLVDDHFGGAGQLGDGSMILDNEAAATIVNAEPAALTINTGAQRVINAGRIETDGSGGVVVESAVANTGTLFAVKGTLSLEGVVTGSGIGEINGGVLFAGAKSAFSQNVEFMTGGTLKLGDSHAYFGTVSGFSKTGATALDLTDIAFKSGTTTASYAGTTVSGVLTVTSGSEVARVHFIGNYLSSTWTLSNDGSGGTKVVDPTGGGAAAPGFVQTMAGIAPRPASAISHPLAGASPHLALALATSRTSLA